MPTENWYTISATPHDLPAGYDDFAPVGGGNDNSAVRVGGDRAGPATHDDNTTYDNCFANGFPNIDQAYNGDWPGPIGTFDGVFRANVRWRVGTTAGGGSINTTTLNFCNAAGTKGTAFDSWGSGTAGTAWANRGPTSLVGFRPGGGAWVAGDFVNDKTMFPYALNSDNGGGGNGSPVWITSYWGDLSYIPPAGGFVFLLNLVGASALPFVGALTDLSHFRRYLSWRERFHPRHTTWGPGEVLDAWRDVRAYRAPRYFLPA